MGCSWIDWNRDFPVEFSVFLWSKQSQEMLFCWTYRLVMNLFKVYTHFLGFFFNATLIRWYFLKSIPSDNMKQITILPSKDFVLNEKNSQGPRGMYVADFQKDSCSFQRHVPHKCLAIVSFVHSSWLLLCCPHPCLVVIVVGDVETLTTVLSHVLHTSLDLDISKCESS